MFTGIIECSGLIKEVIPNGDNRSFFVESAISDALKIDQSVSHSGVCLTVEEKGAGWHRVTAIAETLKKTNLQDWKPGMFINLERSLKIGDRLDGHLVQGHVDATGTCIQKKDKKGSREFSFSFPKEFNELVIEKGSIALNGISLTIFSVRKKSFSVAIIPYTFEITNLKELKRGDLVNLEFDLIGKYINRSIHLQKK